MIRYTKGPLWLWIGLSVGAALVCNGAFFFGQWHWLAMVGWLGGAASERVLVALFEKVMADAEVSQ